MFNFKSILVIRAGNKILFQTGFSGKYELITVNRKVSLDEIKEYVRETYNLKVNDCQEMSSYDFSEGRTYYICADKPEVELPFDCKWFTLLTAAGKLTDEKPYPEIKEFLRHQAEISNVQLQFGLREGKIIAVGELSPDERGLKCGCICPVCEGALVARLGAKKQAHFAHYKATDCDTASAQQTALHLLAKELIAEAKGMFLPAAMVSRKEVFANENNEPWEVMHKLPSTLEYRPAGFYPCSEVILEKKVSDIIPDIVLVQGEQRILVEIAVTHFINEEKQNKIEALGMPVLEVDLSELRADELNREELRKRLFESPEGKDWVFLPETQTRQASIEKYYSMYKETQQVVAEEKKRQIQGEKRRTAKEKAAEKKYNRLLQPKLYRETLVKRRSDEETYRIIRQFRFSNDPNYSTVPFFLDIPTTGDLVFDCDRRIWQAAIFDKFIYNRNMEASEPARAHVKKVASWAVKHQNIFRLDWDLMPKVFSRVGTISYQRSLLEQGIREFMWHMFSLGFISNPVQSQAKILVAHSIVPPNEDVGKILAQVLGRVDLFSPEASDSIRENMEDFALWQKEQEEKAAQALLREEAEKERQVQYEAGMQEILDGLPEDGFDGDVMLKDSFDHRWFQCVGCGSIVRDSDMAFYGGANSVNKGICRECSRRGQ